MGDFFNAQEQYLVVIASCVGAKIKPKQEPFLDSFFKKFEYANIYTKRSDGSKDRPGTIKIMGNGREQRLIIICYAQYYVGKNNLPNDSREQRLIWFKQCLEKISKIPNLSSLAFPKNIMSDGGGSVEAYLQAITDLTQYIKLEKANIKINIYEQATTMIDNPEKLVSSEPPIVKYEENPDWLPISKLPIHDSWNHIFQDSIIQTELEKLDNFFRQELKDFGDFVPILPQPAKQIFRVFQDPLERVRVVILGQDPYHSDRKEAMGLAFSVNREVKIPPSLRNIYKELSDDLTEFTPPSHGNLEQWAKQGVLLLNTSLTVRYKKPTSHLKIWQTFTDRIIELLASDQQKPKVFLLWGNPAQKKAVLIKDHNYILTATHPSPLSASRGWFGTSHFSKTNQKLKAWSMEPINWSLDG